METPSVLALDLEGSLISNVVSQIPRPGLFEFLKRCNELFPRIVVYSTVPEHRFREVAMLLVAEGQAPAWFAKLECVTWTGQTKNLAFIEGADVRDVLLVDDFMEYVHPGQEHQFVRVEHFDFPYAQSDIGLAEVLKVLVQRTGPSN